MKTREELLAIPARTQRITVPVLGELILREPDIVASIAIGEAETLAEKVAVAFRYCVVSEAGDCVFTDADMEWIRKQCPAKASMDVFNALSRLSNGATFSEDAVEAALKN